MKKNVSPLSPSGNSGFTLVELLVVMVIIAILAGLVLMGAGFAQQKAARTRAQTEIKAMESSLERYKLDNGIYPRTTVTDTLNPKSDYDPSKYKNASLALYDALTGDVDHNRKISATEKQNNGGTYMDMPPNMLFPVAKAPAAPGNVQYISDPFGYSYGYSTAYAAGNTTSANNPTFDLWSTGGRTTSSDSDKAKWLTNWD